METEKNTCSCGRTVSLTVAAKELFAGKKYYFCQWCGSRFEIATGEVQHYAEQVAEVEEETPTILYSSEVSVLGENEYQATVTAWQLLNGKLGLIDKFTADSIPTAYALAEFMAPSSSNIKCEVEQEAKP